MIIRYLLIIFSFTLLISCEEKPQPVSDSRVNDYALYDESDNFHRLSFYNNNKAIVLFVQGNGCPIVRNAISDYHEIATEYQEKGFKFFMINSNIQDNRKSIKKEADSYNFKIPVLVDSAQLLADELDITITGEIIVLHPTDRSILYRGPINDRLDYESQKDKINNHYLKKTLDQLLLNEVIVENEIPAKGCKVTRLSSTEKENHLTYTKDIAPILADRCVKCHNENGIAPWAMSDYNMVNGWSSMMKEVLISKRMPPWSADPEIGEFKNSLVIEDSNLRKVIRWIKEGRTYGEGKDTLKTIKPASYVWKKGIPDTIIQLKTEKIPATGIVPYRFQKFTLDLPKDSYLKAVEIQPGNAKVVHHITLNKARKPQFLPAFNRKEIKHIDSYIAFSASEDNLTEFPEGTGYFIEKDNKLVVQIHYATTGKEEIDQTKIGLYFHDEKPEKEMFSLGTSNYIFEIPSYGENIAVTATDTVAQDIKMYFLSPHMHYRGKSTTVSIEYPNGKKEKIISVGDYNFNWQRFYKFKEPLFIPKGSVIKVDSIFDNTFQNSFNPDPSKDLKFGRQSLDEMMIAFFNYTIEE